MQEKLREYRNQHITNSTVSCNRIANLYNKIFDNKKEPSTVSDSTCKDDIPDEPTQVDRHDQLHPPCDVSNSTTDEIYTDTEPAYKWTVRGLKTALWVVLLLLFNELHFGAVFFITSMFYFVYASLDNRPRKVNKLSAYSVFNPNCERLDGTFTAEQFEKQMFRGGL